MTAQGGDTYLKDMLDMSEMTSDGEEPSQIIQFFTGRNVLVTGGSGFVGKLLIEKLLRTCPSIAKLYVFMRPKKGKSIDERFKEHFEDPVYDRLKQEQPDYGKKVVVIKSDVIFADLGLSAEDRRQLLDTHVIFHGAATVRFDEKLRTATHINIRGTKQLLLLAKEMPNLKAFIHISTAFSHCVLKFIDEKFYTSPMEPEKLLTLLDILDDATLENITPAILGKFPNTYAFTKAVGEDVVRQYSTGLAISIVRPSIVIATAEEPRPGWINNLYGPTGVVVGAGIGLLRTLHCKPENVADIIPADYVIANIIAVAWDTAQNGTTGPLHITNSTSEAVNCEERSNSTSKKLESEDSNLSKPDSKVSDASTINAESGGAEEIPIYNTVSSCQAPITWGQFMKFNEVYGLKVPSDLVMWYYMFALNRYLFVHNIYVFFLHLVPAVIVDLLAYLTGRKPMLLDAYRKIHKFSAVISYFSTQQWRFRNANVVKLWDKLNATDRMEFNFNLKNLIWNDYFSTHMHGLRLYILKDPIATLERGRVKYARLRLAHYTLVTLISIFAIWCFYKLFNNIISW